MAAEDKYPEAGAIDDEDVRHRLLNLADVGDYDECWEWQGAVGAHGYGQFGLDGSCVLAHRASYRVFCGEIPEGKVVMHLLHNPLCINPRHLQLGTQGENQKQAYECGNREPLKGTQRKDGRTAEEVRAIRDLYAAYEEWTQERLADLFNTNQVSISDIVNRESYDEVD